mgnify:CR=1 FL=1
MKKASKKKKSFENSLTVKCPACNKSTFKVIQKTDTIPHFGEVLETFASCESCGYKTNDILPLEKHEPVDRKIEINSDVLEWRIVKSKFCTIEFPELGITIEPGPGSEAYISNIEGLINRTIEALSRSKKVVKNKDKEVDEIVSKLEDIKQGKGKLTLKIKDKTGQSKIITNKN